MLNQGIHQRMRRYGWWPVLAVLLMAAACGSSEGGDVAAAVQTTAVAVLEEVATTAAPASTTEAPTTTTSAPAPTTAAPATLVSATSHLFGGLTFDYPSDHILRQTPNDSFFFVRAPGWNPRNRDVQPGVGVAWVSQTFAGQPVASIENLVEIAEIAGGGDVTEGSESLDVIDLTARRFEFRDVDERPLFSGKHLNFPGESWWTPSSISDAYLADLGDSVLVMWAEAGTQDDVDQMTSTLRQIASSMVLLSEEIPTIPVPDVGITVDFGPPPEIVAAERRDNGVSTFGDPSFQPAATRFQFHRLGFHLEMTLVDDLIVPRHQPGFLVVANVGGMGAHQHDLRFHMAMAGLAPMGSGPVPIGDPLSIDPIEALLDNPPPNLQFSDVDLDADVGGLQGVSFDVSIVDSQDCGGVEKPCNYAFMGPLDEIATVLGWGHVHRVWLVEDVPNGPLLIMASAPETGVDAWMAKVEEMLSGMAISVE